MVIASSKPNLPISIPIAISFASSFKWDVISVNYSNTLDRELLTHKIAYVKQI